MGEGAGKNHFFRKKFCCVIIWDRGCGIMGEKMLLGGGRRSGWLA